MRDRSGKGRGARKRAFPALPVGIVAAGLLLMAIAAVAVLVLSRTTPGGGSSLTAQEAYKSGHFRSAESMLERDIEAKPDDFKSRRLLAVVLSAEGKNSEAIKAYAEVVKLAPSDDASWYSMALLERASGDASLSAEHLQKALSLKKGDYTYTDELARTRMELGGYAEAARLWGSLLQDRGLARDERIKVLILQGQAFQADKDYVAAKRSFQAALKLDPKNEALQATVKSFE